MRKLLLYFNTIKYLKIRQVLYQLKIRLIKNKTFNKPKTYNYEYQPLKLMIEELDLDEYYLSRFDINKLLKDQIVLLNEEHTLNKNSWYIPEASHLWNFNLHYFEYAIALAGSYYKDNDVKYYIKFKELLNSWIDCNKEIKGDAWQPYTISLRIPNLLICFELFGDIFEQDIKFRDKVIDNIYLQYKYLLNNQELHLLGNHYFENLKTILICSIFFNEVIVYKSYIKKLIKEIDEQILGDGLHFELSLMYHKIVLEDLIRVAVCIRDRDKENKERILKAIKKMVDALASLDKGMGKMPLFNDSGDGVAKESYQLLKATKRLFDIEPILKTSFPISGYYKYYNENIAIMFDAGKLGPGYMPGHGHCDALSFELSIDNRPIFVNSGTYQYQGALRNYFRSTEAHNTVKIGNQQQSEYWDEHRVARRIRNVKFSKIKNGMMGSYKNFLGNSHRRKIFFNEYDELIIRDYVTSKHNCSVHTYLHFAPHLIVKEGQDSTYNVFDTESNKFVCSISSLGIENVVIHCSGLLSNYSPMFGCLKRKIALEFQWKSVDKYSEIKIIFYK